MVAFPQLGLLTEPGTADLIEQSLKERADIIGGLDPIGVDGDRDGRLDLLFAMAERTGRPLDIHLHDRGLPGLDQVAEIARRTVASGMQGKVAINHVFCLADSLPGRRCAAAPTGRGTSGCVLGTPAVPAQFDS
ncbi:hypothetical protein [Streptomyces sp. NPDC056323]|uniref:hypothetical protein n=1 Tax=unclassified Streptomyces TaxID=2593676 RepID=UPI0035D5D26F